MTHLQVSQSKLDLLRGATADDNDLQLLAGYILNGWPMHQTNLPMSIRPFWHLREELHMANDIIFVGERLVIPATLRSDILQQIHKGHFGQEKCKARAHQVVFWPSINSDIQSLVAKCSARAKFRPAYIKETLLPRDLPPGAVAESGIDILHFAGKHFLLIVDYFSKYPEVISICGLTAKHVVEALKSVFARHGIPKELFMDNMPFASPELRKFAQEWGFKVTTSRPVHIHNVMNNLSVQYRLSSSEKPPKVAAIPN